MRIITTALAIAALIATVASADAQPVKVGALVIENAWARATLPNAPVAGAYMTIKNTGKTSDRLIGGTTSAAKEVQVHEMKMDGSVMTMRRLKDGLEIPAGGTVTLQPGGVHLMLMKPAKRIREGETLPVTLMFKKAGSMKVDFAVEKPDAMRPTSASAGSAVAR
ncbi:copper chaperone PCu(A)C [Jiella sp. MQZ9-1]|uniref:Copper chaperone PCu(A)C n=1 Tax=Jiella flava TaxID=2816857 RepID=A0A939FT04_9HYPH|nr:copper chaperone PCu(A)C [Jiella flava]MBO0661002.1 copper chaperone PCu(A)C [Jiella flava]MCD2469650.1 copper chaperone PCu(A)C [Jiella flava]